MPISHFDKGLPVCISEWLLLLWTFWTNWAIMSRVCKERNCVFVAPNNTKTVGRMTCLCFLRPIIIRSSSYATRICCCHSLFQPIVASFAAVVSVSVFLIRPLLWQVVSEVSANQFSGSWTREMLPCDLRWQPWLKWLGMTVHDHKG